MNCRYPECVAAGLAKPYCGNHQPIPLIQIHDLGEKIMVCSGCTHHSGLKFIQRCWRVSSLDETGKGFLVFKDADHEDGQLDDSPGLICLTCEHPVSFNPEEVTVDFR